MDSQSRVTLFTDEINNRHKSLFGDYSCFTAIVAGLGGVGSWVAIDLALMGMGTIILFDDDVIEASNLNRTLFRLNQIGKPKTEAVKDLIMERRKDVIVIPMTEKLTSGAIYKYIQAEYIFDCTDTSKLKDSIAEIRGNTKPETMFPKYVKLGYDGYEGTICMNQFNTGQWGEDSSYTITPSFFGTPQIISGLAVIELVMKNKLVSKTVNINVKRVINLLETENTMKN